MRTKLLILIMTTLALTACQQGQASNDPSVERLPPQPLVEPIDPTTDPVAAVKARKKQMIDQQPLSAMRAEIMALIGDAQADNIQQCRVVEFGSKPCGGPASYIALSTKDGNESEIMALISKYNAAQKAENARLGLMSDCAVVPKPGVILENGVCTLKGAGNGSVF
ncbi:hypothetical protein [Rheinheimera baltica]|jgi:hypothetical protein|uniref:Lipoprotein n=1 Tax=Rheinheimera baltica TaxID=67576 RepID=A0ABT9I4U8_9GAMM|nr:hypothetical protein [Rheinheimera baltica]MDP5138394.1 hypothetical protein [Rheinheimera baltica]MDP5149458.1 hypothetical protein [Rheinheimera baltica]MDP5188845.1 hypothetical protein [Rheinheimera baltica]